MKLSFRLKSKVKVRVKSLSYTMKSIAPFSKLMFRIKLWFTLNKSQRFTPHVMPSHTFL